MWCNFKVLLTERVIITLEMLLENTGYIWRPNITSHTNFAYYKWTQWDQMQKGGLFQFECLKRCVLLFLESTSPLLEWHVHSWCTYNNSEGKACVSTENLRGHGCVHMFIIGWRNLQHSVLSCPYQTGTGKYDWSR